MSRFPPLVGSQGNVFVVVYAPPGEEFLSTNKSSSVARSPATVCPITKGSFKQPRVQRIDRRAAVG